MAVNCLQLRNTKPSLAAFFLLLSLLYIVYTTREREEKKRTTFSYRGKSLSSSRAASAYFLLLMLRKLNIKKLDPAALTTVAKLILKILTFRENSSFADYVVYNSSGESYIPSLKKVYRAHNNRETLLANE